MCAPHPIDPDASQAPIQVPGGLQPVLADALVEALRWTLLAYQPKMAPTTLPLGLPHALHSRHLTLPLQSTALNLRERTWHLRAEAMQTGCLGDEALTVILSLAVLSYDPELQKGTIPWLLRLLKTLLAGVPLGALQAHKIFDPYPVEGDPRVDNTLVLLSAQSSKRLTDAWCRMMAASVLIAWRHQALGGIERVMVLRPSRGPHLLLDEDQLPKAPDPKDAPSPVASVAIQRSMRASSETERPATVSPHFST